MHETGAHRVILVQNCGNLLTYIIHISCHSNHVLTNATSCPFSVFVFRGVRDYWNMSNHALSAEILSSYEAKLTASYSETYTQGTNAGVTVAVTDGEHGTVTSGESTHTLGMLLQRSCRTTVHS